jgi:hypothetical protein
MPLEHSVTRTEDVMGFSNPFGGVKVYVSPPGPGAGLENGAGTFEDPYHSIRKGIESAAGGGVVFLRGGPYEESVAVRGVSGTWLKKIVVRPYKTEHVTIDALIPDFLNPPADVQWDPVGQGEYVWRVPLDEGIVPTGGAFMDRSPHTRLVKYDWLQDMQSDNELWPKGELGDNIVWLRHKKPGEAATYSITEERRRWVYMGPGIWFDPDTRRVHVRLSPTHHGVDGLQEYAGESDPNQVRLALSEQDSHALFLRDCSHLYFKNLTVRYGGQDTIRLRNCTDVTFDHVNIRAASRAIRLQNDDDHVNEKNIHIVVKHCEIDGGLPPWFFRTDRKDTYYFDPANNPNAPAEDIKLNNLGASTGGVLISGGKRTSHVTVHHCEISNGHDAYVFGDKMRFHHNLVHNLNDDGLAISGEAGPGTSKIYQNVITQCMTVPSFGADGELGQTYFYRNLVDIRTPIAGIRPAFEGDPRSLRNGHFYKGDAVEGPFDLFHNTCLVLDPGGPGKDDLTRGFAHYSGQIEHGGRRRAHNNIFVAAYSGVARELAFLPPAAFNGPTDGNTYFRIPAGPGTPDSDPDQESMFLVRTLPDRWTPYESLADYRDAYWAANPEDAYEKDGTFGDPEFRTFDLSGDPHPDEDDLRLRPDSSTPDGVTLPPDLLLMDLKVRDVLHLGTRVRGCYRFSTDRMRVGVKGRRVYPPPSA